MTVYRLGGMEMVGSKQQLCLHLLPRNTQQSKRPCPSVSDKGSAKAEMVDTV